MVIARNILALLLLVTAANTYAVALQGDGPSGAASRLDTGSRSTGQMRPGDGEPFEGMNRKLIDDQVLQVTVGGGRVAQPAFSNEARLPRSESVHTVPEHWGMEPGHVAGTVPAPAAIWAFGVALIGFAGIARRRGEPVGDSPPAAMDAVDVAANV